MIYALTYHKNCHRKNTKTVVKEEKRIDCVCVSSKKNKMRVVQKESLKIGYGTQHVLNDNAQQECASKK